MMIYKVPVLDLPGTYDYSLPGFVRWLDAGEQGGDLVAWAEVNRAGPDVPCSLVVMYTGQESHETNVGRFLRSVQIGSTVCHVFASHI